MRHPVTSRSRQRQQASSDTNLHAVRVDGHEAQVPVATPDLTLEACGPVGGLSDRRPRVLREPPMAGIHISRGPSTLIAAACGRALGEHLPDQRTCSPCPVDRSGPIATSPRVEGTGAYALARSRGSVTVPGVAIARRVASARYAAGSTPASFADSSSV